MNTIVTAAFDCKTRAVRTAPVFRFDRGAVLTISGLELPAAYQVQFANGPTEMTKPMTVYDTDSVEIPEEYTQTGEPIYAYIYFVGDNYGVTKRVAIIPVNIRGEISADQPDAQQASWIDAAIAALNQAVEDTQQSAADAETAKTAAQGYAEQATTAATAAEAAQAAAQQSALDAQQAQSSAASERQQAETAANNAQSAQSAAETAQASAQLNAQAASQSADSANTAKTAAETARSGAETAKSDAESAAADAAHERESAMLAAGAAGSAMLNAQTAQTAAETSATAAQQSATAAAQSATGANAAKTDAESSKTAAAASAAAAQAVKDSIPADYTSLNNDVIELKSTISGTGTSSEMTLADGINLVEGASAYTSSASYGTWYFPVEKGESVILTFQSTSSNSFVACVGLSESIPSAGGAATYLGKLSVPGKSTNTFECVAVKDGYISASWWKDSSRSASAVVYSDGIAQSINEINADLAEYDAELTSLQNFREYVTGQTGTIVASLVDGLNLAENATKYTSSSNYATNYVQITSGNKYVFSLNNQNANSWTIRIGYTESIPANNIAASYIESTIIPSKNTGSYSYTAKGNGYLSLSYYKMTNANLSDAVEISNGLEQHINKNSNRITALEGIGSEVNDINAELESMKGQTVQLESGTYWGATTVGSSLESDIQTSTSSNNKRTMLSLPANSVLRIMGVGVSTLTRLYWAFRADDGVLIDIADEYDQLAPRSYYLRYEVDTHIYINCANNYDHFISIVDDISPWTDISKTIGTTTRKIIDFGERDIRYAVRNMKRKSRNSSYAPVLFLHFSDIHGDAENLKRLMEFASDYHISYYLNDILCTGDVVKSTLDDGLTWFDGVSGTDKILLLPGNHDSVKGAAANPTTATKQEMYEALFAGRVSEWGVTQPEGAASNYLGYYYKDYATQKLRLICLDANGSGDYHTAEVEWLTDALEGAYALGYSVVCAEHFMFAANVCSGVKCTFQSDEAPENEGSWVIPNAYINAVETFIDGGGDFVCWLGGHVHKDRVWIHENTHQLCIGVTTASHESHQISYEDSERITGDKSQDSFNIVGIDTYTKHLTILKIGSDMTRTLAHKHHLCIDYANRTVVHND